MSRGGLALPDVPPSQQVIHQTSGVENSSDENSYSARCDFNSTATPHAKLGFFEADILMLTGKNLRRFELAKKMFLTKKDGGCNEIKHENR